MFWTVINIYGMHFQKIRRKTWKDLFILWRPLDWLTGPGVRFVVFLQGCRMRCRYCHNPETWKLEGGTPWTADKLFSHVYRYKSYWNKKGQPNGGITVSGGEPLLQIDFVTEFFKKAREKGVHTALDTAGNPFTLEEPFISKFEELMKVTDLVILDFKEIEQRKTQKINGMSK